MSHEILASTFDQWASEGRDARMETEHGPAVRQVLARMGMRAGDQMLDLGCGNGWATRLLAKSSPGGRAVGVDVSPAMIAQAEALHSYTIRARYEVMPFERLDFKEGQFERVFSMEALYYAVDLQAALAEIHRVLKPGGTVDVVIDYYKENTAAASWAEAVGVPMHWMTGAEWLATFAGAGFAEVTTELVSDESAAEGTKAASLWIHGVRP